MLNEFAGQIFDSRDVDERIDELEPTAELLLELTDKIQEMAGDSEHDPDTLSDLEADKAGIDMDEIDEYNELLEFKNCVGSTEWTYGITFIRGDCFEEYAREFAEDIGAINSEIQWPATCIDWEQAAQELQMDYSSVEFGDDTYYYLS